MKIVLNRCYGGFGLKRQYIKALGYEYDGDVPRTDSGLIELIERLGPTEVSDVFADLEIVEIPDSASDWRIEEYDGAERVLYVLDGRICEA